MREWISPGTKLRLVAAFVGIGALLAALTAAGSARAATQKKLTIYSVATLAQFINHQDDRQRAVRNNPFAKDVEKLITVQKGEGPFPGDSTLYSFDLYTSPKKGKKAGTATYTCHYNFDKRALCIAYFKLNGSTLLASGPVNFSSTSFTLPLTGGTNKYIGANGQVGMTQVANNLQRLNFLLLG